MDEDRRDTRELVQSFGVVGRIVRLRPAEWERLAREAPPEGAGVLWYAPLAASVRADGSLSVCFGFTREKYTEFYRASKDRQVKGDPNKGLYKDIRLALGLEDSAPVQHKSERKPATPKTPGPNSRMGKALQAIRDFRGDDGTCEVGTIAECMGWSDKSTKRALKRLEAKGLVRYISGKNRFKRSMVRLLP